MEQGIRMILDTVKKTIKKHRLLQEKDRVLIAYSGGPDSTALLFLLLELHKELALEILLAHFNHKLRRRAEEDERFVEEMARKQALPLFLGAEDVQRYAKERRWNTEEAARRLRYDFLKKTASQAGANKIATGHTMSDQAETLLMRLLRGSGLRGLAGIYPAVEGVIIRPLIEVERKDVEAYLKEKSLPYRIDESNFDRRFFRNRIRLELIPYIQRNLVPSIILQLGRIAFILQEEEALLDELGKKKAQKAIIQTSNQALLEWKSLSSLPLALQRRVVREFMLRLKGDLRDVSFKDVESVLGLGKGKEFQLGKDLILQRQGEFVSLKKRASPKARYEYSWSARGLLEIKELGLSFRGRRMEKKDIGALDFNDERKAFIDRAKLRFPLLIRNRKEGDRYQSLGAPGKKKLKEIMRAKGIPTPERGRRPVFLSGREIVWVLGLPVGEKFKIDKTTKDIFVIEKL